MRKSSVLVKLIAALVSGTVAFTAVPVTAYAKEEIRAEVEDISVTEDLDALNEVSEPDPQQGSVSDNTNPAEESSTVSEDSPYSHVGMDNYGLIPSEESDDAANIAASMITTKNSGLSIASLDLDANEPYYITTADSYEGDGSTPEIAESLKADRQLYNNCWVYSVTKSIEANMALKGVYTNLSETNITYYYHHPVGNLDKSQGQALKNAYVYPDYAKGNWKEMGGYASSLNAYFVEAWRGLVPQENVGLKSDAISGLHVYDEIGHVKKVHYVNYANAKSFIKKYGAVTCTLSAHDAVYYSDSKKYNNAWYCDDDKKYRENHMVSIIGWDDNYSKENFKGKCGKPQNNGAFYCINSWGNGDSSKLNGCDKNGGFWLSYDDVSYGIGYAYEVVLLGEDDFYSHNYFSGSVNATNLDNIWLKYNDKIGISYEVSGSKTQKVEAIKTDFYCFSNENAKWSIKAYKGNYDNKVLVSEQIENIDGDNTDDIIKLNNPFVVNEGESFYVEISPIEGFDNRNKAIENYQIATFDSSVEHYNNDGSVSTLYGGDHYGHSYKNGQELPENIQLGIHVYTTDVTEAIDSKINIKNPVFTKHFTDSDVAFSSLFSFEPGRNNRGIKDFIKSVKSSNPNVARVNFIDETISFPRIGQNEQTTWGEEGTAKITIETMLGEKASFDINVSKKDISEAVISGVRDAYCMYAVEQLPVKPGVSKVTWNNQELSSTSDYSVSYGDNNSVTKGIGYGTVIITGKENFKGTLTKKFKIIIPQKSVIKLKGVTEYDNNEFGGMDGIINVKWSQKSLNIMDYIDFTPGVDTYGNTTSLKIEQSFETPAVELDGTIVKWDTNDWCNGQIYHVDIDSYGDHAELELHFEDDREFTDPDPTAPTGSSDPSDDPSVPSDPANQTPSSSDPEPANPADPSEDPTTPSDPAASTDPSDDPTTPSDPADPSEPSDKPSLPSTPSAPSGSGTDTSTSAARKMITVEVGPYTVTYPAEITFIGRKADFASGEVLVSENGISVGYGKIKVSRATKTGSTTFKILKPGAPGSLSGKEAKSALKALKKYKFSVEVKPYEVTEKDTVEVTGKSGSIKKVAVNGIKLKKNEFSGTEESVTFSGRFTGTWKKN